MDFSLKNMTIFGVRDRKFFIFNGQKFDHKGFFFPPVAMVNHVIRVPLIRLFIISVTLRQRTLNQLLTRVLKTKTFGNL